MYLCNVLLINYHLNAAPDSKTNPKGMGENYDSKN